MAWYNIPTDPVQRNWLVGGGLLLLLIIPFRIYYLTPRKDDNAEVLQHVETLETVNRRASVLAAQGGGDLEARLALYEQHVAKLEELIPGRDEVPALLDDISSRARQLNVEQRELQPQPREPGQYYDKTSYLLTFVGEYHSIGRFLTDIASLPRIVTPVQLDLQRFNQPQQYPDLESPVLASFRIETYVLPDSSSAPPPAQIGGAQ